MKIFPFAVLCIVSFSAASADTSEIKIRHYDGRPASGAVVTVYKGSYVEARQLVIDKLEYEADAEGVVEIDLAPDPARQMLTCVAIRAEGAATEFGGSIGEVILAPDFEVEGIVQTEAGQPVPDAEVRVVHFGWGTHLPIVRHQMEAAGLPEFQTRTDAEGRYSLPGATLRNSRRPVRGVLNVTAHIDGKLHTGSLYQPYFSDSEFFDREKHQAGRFEHPGPLTVYPSGTIRGTVVDFTSGEPVAGVKLSYSSFRFQRHAVETGPDGRFRMDDAHRHGRRVIHVTHPDYPRFHLRESAARSSDADIDEMQIVMRPLVKFNGRIVDGETRKAAPMQLGVRYQHTEFDASGKWTVHFHDIEDDDVKTGADAAVDLELPAGLNRLALFPVRNPEFRSAPYEIESFANVRPDGKTVEIPLVRRKGILFKTVMPGDPGQNDPRWGGLSVRAAHKEFHPRGGRSIRHGFYRNLWFYPVDKWGDKVTVSVEFSRGKQREMLLEPTAFAALKDVSWPVRIKVFPPPEFEPNKRLHDNP